MPVCNKLLQEAIAVLKKQGAEVVEVELGKQLKKIGNAEYTVLLYEFKDGLNQYLSTANAKVKTLEDVIAFNKAYENKAMPFFKQETLEYGTKQRRFKQQRIS
jgi:amidase